MKTRKGKGKWTIKKGDKVFETNSEADAEWLASVLNEVDVEAKSARDDLEAYIEAERARLKAIINRQDRARKESFLDWWINGLKWERGS